MANSKGKHRGLRNLLMMIFVLCLLGLIFTGTSIIGRMLLGDRSDWNWLGLSLAINEKSEYDCCRYTADPDVMERIVLEMEDRRIEVVEYDGDEIVLELYASRDDCIEVTEEQTTFFGKLESKIEKKNVFASLFDRLQIFEYSGEHKTVLLHLPSRYIGDLDIHTSNGDITLDNPEDLGDVKLKTSNGSVVLKQISLSRLEIETSNGSVKLENIFADWIEGKTSNASIEAVAVRAHDMLALTTSNGKITATEIDSNDICLKSSNGKITAALSKPKSDFTMIFHTSNGKSNIESGGSGYKKLNIQTGNADIVVSFGEEN